MTPLDWSNVPKMFSFYAQIFNEQGTAPLNDVAVSSVASKSSSSKSCTLPSITSTKHSRLSTPSFSSGDGKGKRALSFSPLSDHFLSRSHQQQASMEIHSIPISHRSDLPPPRTLAPLIEPAEHQCQWSGCDLLFSTPTQLTEHIRSVHVDRLDSRTWLCQWESCTRTRTPFKSLYSLFLHLRAHTQDRPFQCTHLGCTKSFTRAEYLRLHERSHTGEKPYPCEYADCSKAFSNPSDRTKHVKRTHLNKREYTCQIAGCGKSYTDPSSLRKHVKHVHGEEAFRQKKHKRTDDSNDPSGPDGKNPLFSIRTDRTLHSSHGIGHLSTGLVEHQNNLDDDDDEDIIVDQGVSAHVDMLGNNLEGLSVGTSAVLSTSRLPMRNRLHQIMKKAVLPAIQITGVTDVDNEETVSNPGQQGQVAFRSFHQHQHRISAQSGSTAYGSMRSDSMNIESALFLPSNHSSLISLAQHPSTSPYEYDYCPSNDQIRYDTRSTHALAVPPLPSAPSHVSGDQHLTLPGTISSASQYSQNELSPSSSFCMSTLSGDGQRTSTTASPNPKLTHLLYFLQSLECQQHEF